MMDYEAFTNWLMENLDKSGMAALLRAVDKAGEQAVAMVDNNPLGGPYFVEMVYDDLAYRLRDHINVFTWEQTEPESGVKTWYASREDEVLLPTPFKSYAGVTELDAISHLLDREYVLGIE